MCKEDVYDAVNDRVLFLTYKCNNRCLVWGANSEMRYRLPPYLNLPPDNTKNSFVALLNCVSGSCWGVLHKIRLVNSIKNDNSERNKFKSSRKFFHPACYILPIRPDELPISPYKS